MTNPNIIKVIYGSENLGIGVITVWQDLKILDLEVTLVAEDEIRLPFFRENALRVGLLFGSMWRHFK